MIKSSCSVSMSELLTCFDIQLIHLYQPLHSDLTVVSLDNDSVVYITSVLLMMYCIITPIEHTAVVDEVL